MKDSLENIDRALNRNHKYAPADKGGRGLPHPTCKKCKHETNSLHHVENCLHWKLGDV